MQAAPKPINEAARLRSLSEYRILGTKPEQAFDNITQMASEICQSPIALISDAIRVMLSKTCSGLVPRIRYSLSDLRLAASLIGLGAACIGPPHLVCQWSKTSFFYFL